MLSVSQRSLPKYPKSDFTQKKKNFVAGQNGYQYVHILNTILNLHYAFMSRDRTILRNYFSKIIRGL